MGQADGFDDAEISVELEEEEGTKEEDVVDNESKSPVEDRNGLLRGEEDAEQSGERGSDLAQSALSPITPRMVRSLLIL